MVGTLAVSYIDHELRSMPTCSESEARESWMGIVPGSCGARRAGSFATKVPGLCWYKTA